MLPEECLNVDMNDSRADNMMTVVTALKGGDIFGVSHNQVRDAVVDSLDMTFSMIEECQLYRPLFDYYQFCMTDPETCFQMEGFFGRVAHDSFKLGTDAFDMYNLATTDDYCFTDMQIIEEAKRGARDVASLKSAFYGFHGEWNTEAHMDKKSIPAMWGEMQDVYHNMLDVQEEELGASFKGARCPVLGFFKDLMAGEVSIPWAEFGLPQLF